jgi:hypothetical protein
MSAADRLRPTVCGGAEGATLPGTSQAKGPRGRGTSGKQGQARWPRGDDAAVCHLRWTLADGASRAEPDDPARAVKLSGHSDRGGGQHNLAWRG